MPIFLFAENKLIKCAYTKGLEKPRKLIIDHESTTKGLGYRVKHMKSNALIHLIGAFFFILRVFLPNIGRITFFFN